MATVEDLPTGKVVGQFLFVSQDNADAGTKPNAVLVTGYVRFTCSASPILYYSKKVTAVPLVHDAVFDSEGYLMPLDTSQVDGGKVVPGKLERGIELLANAPGVNPEGFTWTATFNLKEAVTGRALSIPAFSFLLSAGETVDVADIFPVGASGGVLITRGESAYETAVVNGFVGTQAEWLTSLLAPKSQFTIGTVTASAAGGAAAVSVTGSAPNHILNFTIPRGIQGTQGIQGPPNVLSIGTVASGDSAGASITGTSPTQVLNLTLPRGPQGIQGIQGVGVPTGGAASQMLQKNTANNALVWVTPNAALVGLGNVNNTSDANKPVSTAQKAYIDTLWFYRTAGTENAFDGNEKVLASLPVTLVAGMVYEISVNGSWYSGPDHAADIRLRQGASTANAAAVVAADPIHGQTTMWTHPTRSAVGSPISWNAQFTATTTGAARLYVTLKREIGTSNLTVNANPFTFSVKPLGVPA